MGKNLVNITSDLYKSIKKMVNFYRNHVRKQPNYVNDIGTKILKGRMDVDGLTIVDYKKIIKHYQQCVNNKRYRDISPYTQYTILNYVNNKVLMSKIRINVPIKYALNMDLSNKYHYKLRKLSYTHYKRSIYNKNGMDTGEIEFYKENYLSFERDLVYVALHNQLGLSLNEIYAWVYGSDKDVTYKESLYYADPYTLAKYIPTTKVDNVKQIKQIKHALEKAERNKYYPIFLIDHKENYIVGLQTIYNSLKEDRASEYWNEHFHKEDSLSFDDRFEMMDSAIELFVNELEVRIDSNQISGSRRELIEEIEDILQEAVYLDIPDNTPIPLTDSNIYYRTSSQLELGTPNGYELRNNNVTMPSSWFFVNPIHETTRINNKKLRKDLNISEYLPLPESFSKLDIPIKPILRQDLEDNPNNPAYHEGKEEWFLEILDWRTERLKGAVTKDTYNDTEFINDNDVIRVKVGRMVYSLEDYQHDIALVDEWLYKLKHAYTPVEPILLSKANVKDAEHILKELKSTKQSTILDEALVRKNALCVCKCKSMFTPEEHEYDGKLTLCNCRCHTRAKRLVKASKQLTKTDFITKMPDERLIEQIKWKNKQDSKTIERFPKQQKDKQEISLLEPKDYNYFKHIIEEFPYYEIVNYYQGNPPLSEKEYDNNGKQVSTPELTIRYILANNDIDTVVTKLRMFNATDFYDLTPVVIEKDIKAPLDLIFNHTDSENMDTVSTVGSSESQFKGKYIESPITAIELDKENEMKLTPEQQKQMDEYHKEKKQVALKIRADLNMSFDEFLAMKEDNHVTDSFLKFKKDYLNDVFMSKLQKQMEISAKQAVEERDDENFDLSDIYCDCCQRVEDEFNSTNNSQFFIENVDSCDEPCEKCLVAFSESYHKQFQREAEEEFEHAYNIGAFDNLDVVKAYKRKLYKIKIPVAPKFAKQEEKAIFEINGETLVKAPARFYYNPMTVTKDAPNVFDMVLPNTSDNATIVKALKQHLEDDSAPSVVRGTGKTKWIVKDGTSYRVLKSKNLGTMQVVTLIEDSLFNEKLAKRRKLDMEKSQVMEETNRLLDSMEEDVKRDSRVMAKLREKATVSVKPFDKELLLRGLTVDENGNVVKQSDGVKKLIRDKLFNRTLRGKEVGLNSVDLLTKKFKDIAPNNLTENVDIGLLITLLFQDKLVDGLEEVSGEAVKWLRPTTEVLRDYYDSDPSFASYLEAITTLSIDHIDTYKDKTLPHILKKLNIDELSNSQIAANILKHIRLTFQESKTAILQKALSEEDERTLQAFKSISKDEIFLDALERAYENKDVDVLTSLLSAKKNMELHDDNTTALLSGRVINEENVMKEALTILDGIKDFRLTTEKKQIQQTLTEIIQMRLLFPISSVVHLILASALEERFKFNVGAKPMLPVIIESLVSLRTKPEEETRLVNGIIGLANRVIDGKLTGAEAIVSELGYVIQKSISTRGEYVSKANGNLQLAETYMIEDGITRELYNRAISIISIEDARNFSEASINKSVFILSKYNVKKIATESQILLSRVATNALGITVNELETLKKSVITAIEQLNMNASDSTDSMLITDNMSEEDYELLDESSDRIIKLRTGFSLINGFSGGGLNPCDLVVVGALPGNHKTGMTMNMFLQMIILNNGLNYVDEDGNLPTAVWYSLEDKQGLVLRKMAQIVMRLTTGVFVDLINVRVSVLHKYLVQTFKKHNWRFIFQFLNPANSTATRIEQNIDALNSRGANVKITTIDYMGKMNCSEQNGGIQSQQLKAMVSQNRNHAVRKGYLLMTPWQLAPSAGKLKQLDEDKPMFITTLSDAQAYKDISDLKTEIDLEILVDRVIPLGAGLPYTMSITRGKEKDTSGATLHNTPLHGFIPFNKDSGTAPLAADIVPVYDDKGQPVFDEGGEVVTKTLKHGYVTRYTDLRTIISKRNKDGFYPSGTKESIPHYNEQISGLPINTLEQLNALIGLDRFGNAIPNKWQHIENITADDIKKLSIGTVEPKVKVNYLPPMDLEVIKAKEDSTILTSKPLQDEETLLNRISKNVDVYEEAVKKKRIQDKKFEKIKRDYNINPVMSKLKSFTPAYETTLLNKSVVWKTKFDYDFLPTDIKNPLNTSEIVDSEIRKVNTIAETNKEKIKDVYNNLDKDKVITIDKKEVAKANKMKEVAKVKKEKEAEYVATVEERNVDKWLKEEEDVKRMRQKKPLSKVEVSEKFASGEFKRKKKRAVEVLEDSGFEDDGI